MMAAFCGLLGVVLNSEKEPSMREKVTSWTVAVQDRAKATKPWPASTREWLPGLA